MVKNGDEGTCLTLSILQVENLSTVNKLIFNEVNTLIIFRFNVRLTHTSSFLVEISEDLKRTMKNYLMSFNTWSLTGVVKL